MQCGTDGLERRVAELEAENAALREALDLANRKLQHALGQLFGRRSEALDPRQLELLLGAVAGAGPEPVPAPAPVRRGAPARRAPGPRKPRIPENLPTEDTVVDPQEVTADPLAYTCIGEEITQELDMVPPRYFRRRLIRRKYVSKADRSLAPVIAPLPPRLVPGGYAGPAVVADVAVKKYVDHLPLHRQAGIMRRHGIEVSRKTLCDWIERAAWWLKPVADHIGSGLARGGYLQIDETPVRYCRGPDGGGGQGYFWVYHRPRGAVLYEWHTGRGAGCLDGMLAEFGGTIQTDGYRAYASYVGARNQRIAEGAALPPIVPCACWAHVRRKFHEALAECPGQAGWAVRQIQHLYAVEAGLRAQGAGPALRGAVRAAQSLPVLRRIGRALRLKLPQHRPTSQMGRAIAYALSLWEQLLVYATDGRIEIDNNAVENAIRPTAIGKKNYLFIGDPEAGWRSAVFYTLLENCRREGINPQEYLQDVLARRPSTPLERIGELTPANWAAARRRGAA